MSTIEIPIAILVYSRNSAGAFVLRRAADDRPSTEELETGVCEPFLRVARPDVEDLKVNIRYLTRQ